MISLGILYTTAVLMAVVAVACTALCVVWSNPAWRSRLARHQDAPEAPDTKAGGLTGWPARMGGWLVSAGIGACALIAWFGCYCALSAL